MRAGIDLGTTFSLIAKLNPNGRPTTIPDRSFRQFDTTPSSVFLGANTTLVGRQAEAKLDQNPQAQIIRFFKRDFGQFRPIAFDINQRAWHPEALAALVLKKLKADYEYTAGEALREAVISIPAHFNAPQRKSVLYAAALAEIPLLGLVEEPVAAALHYGVQEQNTNQKLIFVYDFGGGTFDATVLTLDKKGVYVLAKEGDSQLGGKEFDEYLMSYMTEHISTHFGDNFDWTPLVLLYLRKAAEEVKIALSQPNTTFVRKRLMIGTWYKDLVFNRLDFEKSIKDNIEKTIAISQKCIFEAGLQASDIDTFLLVGGSSMIPCIQNMLAKGLNIHKEKIRSFQPMKAVVHGATLRAAQLAGEAISFGLPPEFRGVTGYHLGIRTVHPTTGKISVDTLISKNLPLPCKASRIYYTRSAEQTKMVLELVQYLDSPTDAVSIGQMMIGPLPFPKANYVVEVSVEAQTDGTVKVKAYNPQTGRELKQSFSNYPEESQLMLQQKGLVKEVIINNLG